MRKSRLHFVELFAGAGLFSHSFQANGFHPLLAVEADRFAAESYRLNVGEHVVCGDARELSPPSDCDIIVAGPPCQGFSSLNRNRSNDARNQLTFEIIRWIDCCKPSLVVIENVAPYLKSDVYQAYKRRLRRRGYRIADGVLNACDFGVPQYRKRAISIASNRRMPVLPLGRERVVTVREAWCGLRRRANKSGLHSSPKPTELALARFQAIPEGGDRRDLMQRKPGITPKSWWRLRSNDNTGVWGRMRFDELAPTIRTAFQNPSKGRYIHPCEDRVITIREAARLQNIPDEWKFSGKRANIARQIGNGVPLNLGSAIARCCHELLCN